MSSVALGARLRTAHARPASLDYKGVPAYVLLRIVSDRCALAAVDTPSRMSPRLQLSELPDQR